MDQQLLTPRDAALDHYVRRIGELDAAMDRAQLEGRGDYEALGAMIVLVRAYQDELRKDTAREQD
jgi:hypothetical protein